MKFTIEKNILLENLSNVVKAISTKNIIPILNGVKFELNDEGLFLTASDSELTIRAFIEKKAIDNLQCSTANDCYLMLIPTCWFLFSLLLHLKNIQIANAKILRNCSTLIYVTHCEVLMCVSFGINYLGYTNKFIVFAISAVLLILGSMLAVKISRHQKFQWLTHLW